MTLTRWQRPKISYWSPLRQLSSLSEEINRLFENPLAALPDGTQPFLSGWLPAVDMFQDNDNVIVKAELPGMKKEQISISLHEGVLTLSGEHEAEKKDPGAETCRSERFLGRFQRTLTLPAAVNSDQAKATYKDGILTVTLPKTEEAKPKHIEVNMK